MITNVDEYVDATFSKHTKESYYDLFTVYNVKEYKNRVKAWAERNIELFQKVIKMVEVLPDDTVRTYEVPA
jgi:hypothetical protein